MASCASQESVLALDADSRESVGVKGVSTNFIASVSLKPVPTDLKTNYPWSLPCVRYLKHLKFPSSITFLVGENGSGKSTILEAIATKLGFNPEGGSRNFRFATRESHSPLHEYISVEKRRMVSKGFFLRAESFHNLATEIENMDRIVPPSADVPPVIKGYGGRYLHDQSHGESFLALFLHRFTGNGLYLLDEPEAALSPQRLFTFLARLHQLINAGAQFIIATHSPIILGYSPATIYEIDEKGYHKTDWEQLSHVQLTRSFLLNRDAILKELLQSPTDTEQTDLPL